MAEEQQQETQSREKEDFILLEKIADMTKYGKRAVAQFPRRERQTADEIRACMMSMLRLAIRVKKKYYKKTTLQELDEELAVLRFMIRLAQDPDYYDQNITPPLPKKKYEVWARMNNEIGRIIGGYIKSQKRRARILRGVSQSVSRIAAATGTIRRTRACSRRI